MDLLPQRSGDLRHAVIDMALGRRPALLDAPLTPLRGTPEDHLGRPPGLARLFPPHSRGPAMDRTTDWRGSVGSVVAHGPTAELAMHNAAVTARLVCPRIL
ncbi:hypothetical protein ABT167_18555 [Streptomyces sp. NPDC001792]|uniref:hypothetical protein n=1 Tax=Streptomyces sp. NPDC001792 TaxID=3154524 RepID=UPI003321361E